MNRQVINQIICEKMKRVGFKMKLKPGFKQEYIKRHNEVWPGIAELIKRSGISNYSIFLDEETNILFGIQQVSGNVSSQDLGAVSLDRKSTRLNSSH